MLNRTEYFLPISGEGVICEGYYLRRKEKELIKELVKNPKTYKKENLGLFFKGLKKLLKYNIKYLCTGHGIVIKNVLYLNSFGKGSSSKIQELSICVVR